MRIIIKGERDRQIAIIFVSLRLVFVVVFVVARIKCELIKCFFTPIIYNCFEKSCAKRRTTQKSTTCTHFKFKISVCVWLKTPQTSDETRPK